VIDNPASDKIYAFIIHFLCAKNMSAAEIHRELCPVYGQNVTSEGTVKTMVYNVQRWRTNIHDEGCGRPSVVE
jgi:hypothetical protein